jgi:hypothetical protein
MAAVSRHWFPLAERDDAFVTSAPFRYEQSVETTAPAERVWDVITGYDLVYWVPVWTGLRWGPPPLGVGTLREVTLAAVFTVRERFFRWIEGQRFSFSGLEASLPGLRNVAEDWVIEPTPSGSRLTWTLAIGAHPRAVPLIWLGGPIIRQLQRRVLQIIRVHMRNCGRALSAIDQYLPFDLLVVGRRPVSARPQRGMATFPDQTDRVTSLAARVAVGTG